MEYLREKDVGLAGPQRAFLDQNKSKRSHLLCGSVCTLPSGHTFHVKLNLMPFNVRYWGRNSSHLTSEQPSDFERPGAIQLSLQVSGGTDARGSPLGSARRGDRNDIS